MGRRASGEPPRLLHHKASGQAYATVAGKQVYFGPHGSQAALEAYREFLGHWREKFGRPVVPKATDPGTIAEAVAEYLEDVAPPQLSDGEFGNVRRDLLAVSKRFGRIRPREFRPSQLKAIRDAWLAAGNRRRTVNQRIGRVIRFFSWIVGQDDGRMGAEHLAVLKAVPKLRKPADEVVEHVQPVDWPVFVRTLRHLPARVRSMAIVQFYAGPRSGEICRMRGDEIHTAGVLRVKGREIAVPPGVWIFRPAKRKTETATASIYLLGPKSQAAIRPYIERNPTGYLFSPREAEAERKAALRAARKSKVQPSQRDRSKRWPRRMPGPIYTPTSYARTIARICRDEGLPHWHPHQLRHNFVSRMDALVDLVTASEAVGHSSVNTSLIYLASKIQRVGPIAARVG